REQRQSAADAFIRALALFVVERAGVRAFGGLAAQYGELLGCQQLLPFFFTANQFFDGGAAVRLRGRGEQGRGCQGGETAQESASLHGRVLRIRACCCPTVDTGACHGRR